MSDPFRRVVFYSKEDLAATRHIENAEKIILNPDLNGFTNINDILELYQIKLYFDNEVYLKRWTESEIKQFNKKVDEFWSEIVTYWLKIDDSNIIEHFDELEYVFYDSFWNLINILKTYKKVSSEHFSGILEKERFYIKHVLKHEKIVKRFSNAIKKYFIDHVEAAEVLLSHFESLSLRPESKLFFPKLAQNELDLIFTKYIDSPNANLNYVRLIETITAPELKISIRVKLKAKKLVEKLNSEILEQNSTSSQGIKVSISPSQVEPKERSYDKSDNSTNYSYSYEWLNSTKNPVEVLNNFQLLFNYLNHQGCIDLVSKTSEIDTLEVVMMRSKNDYFDSIRFHQKNLLSQAQLVVYAQFLHSHSEGIETAISAFVNDFLNEEYKVNGFRIAFPSQDSTYLEKIRTLFPEMDSIFRQFDSYTEDGYVDFELIQMSSSTLSVGQIRSNVVKKYFYSDSEEFDTVKHMFFSPQSMIHYVDRFKGKYSNLFQLLVKENVEYDEFEDYQKPNIDYLISKDHLLIENGKIVRIKNVVKTFIYGILFKEGVISYWSFPEDIRGEILSLEEEGHLKSEETLFTIDERKYFNFFLNKKEFVNGPDLRNKYSHGTNTLSEKEQANDYAFLIKLFILVLLKMRDDLHLARYIKNGANNV